VDLAGRLTQASGATRSLAILYSASMNFRIPETTTR
jgi:hypothetical protein